MMLPNGLASDDDAKAFKYASEAASNGLPYHMNVDSYSRTPGSRQPSPSEEDLTKNHSPGLPIAHSVPIKPGDGMGLPPNNPHSTMVGSLTGPIQASGLSNGIGPMSGLVNGGPPGKSLINQSIPNQRLPIDMPTCRLVRWKGKKSDSKMFCCFRIGTVVWRICRWTQQPLRACHDGTARSAL